jgi:hypothetical protein
MKVKLSANRLFSDAIFQLQDDCRQLEQRFNTINDAIIRQTNTQSESLSGFEQRLHGTLDSYKNQLQETHLSPQRTVEANSSLSERTSAEIVKLLHDIKHNLTLSSNSLQNHVPKSRKDMQSHPNAPAQSPNHEADNKMHDDAELVQNLSLLCQLIHEKESTVDNYSDDDEWSESIIQDLRNLVRQAQMLEQAEVQHGS